MFGLLPHPGSVDDQALLRWTEQRALSGTARNTCMCSSGPCHPGSAQPLALGLPVLWLTITFPRGHLLQVTCVQFCLHK